MIETISILSAIGSRNLPKFDSISNFLAKYPSKKSEIQAIKYSNKDNHLYNCSSISINKIITGIKRILIKVKKLGMFLSLNISIKLII